MRGLQRLPPGLLGVSGGRAGADVRYPTLQKMLAQLEGKEPKRLPFNNSVAGDSWVPDRSQRKTLVEALLALGLPELGSRWEPGGETGSLSCVVLVPQGSALAAWLMTPSTVPSCSV